MFGGESRDRHWTIFEALLAAEITALMERDTGEIYGDLAREFGEPAFERVDTSATPAEKSLLSKFTRAPRNGAAFGGLKVIADHGWFAARPSGTEGIYKIYAESFRGAEHLRRNLSEAQAVVSDTLAVEPEIHAYT